MNRNNKASEHLTASEALEEYKRVATFLKWDRRVIGVFCQGGLLVGKYDRTLKEWVVRRDSLESLIGYIRNTYRDGLGG